MLATNIEEAPIGASVRWKPADSLWAVHCGSSAAELWSVEAVEEPSLLSRYRADDVEQEEKKHFSDSVGIVRGPAQARKSAWACGWGGSPYETGMRTGRDGHVGIDTVPVFTAYSRKRKVPYETVETRPYTALYGRNSASSANTTNARQTTITCAAAVAAARVSLTRGRKVYGRTRIPYGVNPYPRAWAALIAGMGMHHRHLTLPPTALGSINNAFRAFPCPASHPPFVIIARGDTNGGRHDLVGHRIQLQRISNRVDVLVAKHLERVLLFAIRKTEYDLQRMFRRELRQGSEACGHQFLINRTTRLAISSSIHDFWGSFGSPDTGLLSEEILDGN
ncbi:hypothetical protein GGX14DRAFT_403486 [Mycena pura]|uniref:Uncharacterized protein n=1 Tax=Mycena pura TaxID=153505 RepID=A0AAD6UZX2_9AGAR|nr:hypothetical protein GGX14DRAFT_403486 [Mycena pura]